MKHLDIIRHQRPHCGNRNGIANAGVRDQRLRMITFAQNADSKQKLFLLDFYSIEW